MSRVRTVVVTEILLVLGLLGFVGLAYLLERTVGLTAAVRLPAVSAAATSAIPALLWLAYFYVQDRHEPEPKHYVLGVYLLGCFVAGPLSGFMTGELLSQAPLAVPSMHPLGADRLIRAFFIVALTQELCKYLAVRYTVYLSAEFDEPMDGLIYMTAVGVGFATWENYQYLQALSGNVFLTTGAAHIVVTTLAHACFAGIMGYALGRAKFLPQSSGRRSVTLLVGLLVAVALSGLFRVVEAAVRTAGLDVQTWRGLAFAAGFAAVIFFVVSILMRRLLAISPFRPLPAAAVPAGQKGAAGDE